MICGDGIHQVFAVLLLLLIPAAVLFALKMKLDKQLNEDGEQSEIDAAAAAKVRTKPECYSREFSPKSMNFRHADDAASSWLLGLSMLNLPCSSLASPCTCVAFVQMRRPAGRFQVTAGEGIVAKVMAMNPMKGFGSSGAED